MKYLQLILINIKVIFSIYCGIVPIYISHNSIFDKEKFPLVFLHAISMCGASAFALARYEINIWRRPEQADLRNQTCSL